MAVAKLWPVSTLLQNKDQFALFVCSFFSYKLLHLFTHLSSLPILLFVLYLPTFLLVDLALIVLGKTLIYKEYNGRPALMFRCIGGLLAFVTAAASSASFSFYFETGGEVQWMAAASLAFGHGGLGLISSGSVGFFLAFMVLVGAAWLVGRRLYDFIDRTLCSVSTSFHLLYCNCRGRGAMVQYRHLNSKDAGPDDLDDEDTSLPGPGPSVRRAWLIGITTIVALSTACVLLAVRPTKPPYAHMSGSLPVTLVTAFLFNPVNSEFCLARAPHESRQFPTKLFHQVLGFDVPPTWGPLSEHCNATNTAHSQDDHGYDPLCDPLKLSNLDAKLASNLAIEMQKSRPRIKNVLLVTLESTRKDMFPFQKDSEVYETILAPYKDDTDAVEQLNRKLARLTSNAQFLTGRPTYLADDVDETIPDWRSLFSNSTGGINVNGAITQAAVTLKSLVSSHCGVEPLPVDFTEEVHGRMYQPCLPHVMSLFNAAEHGNHIPSHGEGEDFRNWPWRSALVQSITDQWDQQDMLDIQMGFEPENLVLSSTLEDPASLHYPPKQDPVNYFGYPEPEIMPYLRDMFVDARDQQRRLFVSHVTSTTHHPFAVPNSWNGKETYLHDAVWHGADPFAAYLNTIRYQDQWISQIFAMLHEFGVLNETLVVMVGDHGLAFDTPDRSVSTYNNGHISNFAIPTVFVHPQLPRIQVNAQTTPTSIIPTILDLLLETDSLAATSASRARQLLPAYQGASMIRENSFQFRTSDSLVTNSSSTLTQPANLKPWHFSAINPGGSMLAISHAGSPYRLILPLCSTDPLRFTDLSSDPWERAPITAWTQTDLAEKVTNKHGSDAATWVHLAGELGRWWFWEQHDRWDYHQAGRREDRAEDSGSGRIKKAHWWET